MFDPNEDLPQFSDVGEVENLVRSGFNVGGSYSSDQMQNGANFMMSVENHPQGYKQSGSIIQGSACPFTRFFALKVLQSAVIKKWHTLPTAEKHEVREFLANFVVHLADQGYGVDAISSSSSSGNGGQDQAYRTMTIKACNVLVEVAKREWPQDWPNFVEELATAAKTNVPMMKVCLLAFQLLGEELFEYEEKKMTKRWIERRRSAIAGDVEKIVEVCGQALDYALERGDFSVANSALSTLEKFLTTFPLSLTYDSRLLSHYAAFLGKSETRVAALKCLSEVTNTRVDPANARTLVRMVSEILFYLVSWLEVDEDLIGIAGATDGKASAEDAIFLQNELQLEERVYGVFRKGNEENCRFWEAATHFLCNAFKTNYLTLLTPTPQATLAHRLIVGASACDNEVYKDLLLFCTEYWRWWSEYLVLGHSRKESVASDAFPVRRHGGSSGGGKVKDSFAQLSNMFGAPTSTTRRQHERLQELQLPPLSQSTERHRNLYWGLLFPVRQALIRAMMKPQEVLVEEDEGGQLRVVELREVEDIVQFQRMRQVLVFVTMIDPDGMKEFLEKLLQKQIDGSEWNWSQFNKICWSAGALSGAMGAKEEDAFYVRTLRALLEFCSRKSGKENKAVIASNVMYIVGQYPRFLLKHPRFFRTVCNKLFDFMREPFPGIKDMAVETLLKLATSVPECFSDPNPAPFVDEIISRIGPITSEIEGRQVHIFYEAMGLSISSIENNDTRRNSLLSLLSGVNTSLEHLYTEACKDQNVALQEDKLFHLLHMLQTLTAVAKSSGAVFIAEMQVVFDALQFFYTGYSTIMQQMIQQQGEQQVLSHSTTRRMKAVKREFLKLVEQYVLNTDDNQYVGQQLWPMMMGPVLDEYHNAPPSLRESALLAVLAACVEKLQSTLSREVPTMLDKTFNATRDMIAANFLDFPDHRLQLFKLLEALNTHCFDALLQYASSNNDIIHGMLWAAKHEEFTVMNSGLNALTKFMREVIRSSMAEQFFDGFYQEVLSGVMECLLNTSHSAGFRQQCEILAVLFTASKRQVNGESSFHPSKVATFLGELLQKHCPALSNQQIQHFLMESFKSCGQPIDFSSNLGDFLIETQVWGAQEENQALNDIVTRGAPGASPSGDDNGNGDFMSNLGDLVGNFLGLDPNANRNQQQQQQQQPLNAETGALVVRDQYGIVWGSDDNGGMPQNLAGPGTLPQSLQALFAVDLYNAMDPALQEAMENQQQNGGFYTE